jgi:hypothetical protein
VGGVVDNILACAISHRKVAIAAGSTKLGVIIVVFICKGWSKGGCVKQVSREDMR